MPSCVQTVFIAVDEAAAAVGAVAWGPVSANNSSTLDHTHMYIVHRLMVCPVWGRREGGLGGWVGKVRRRDGGLGRWGGGRLGWVGMGSEGWEGGEKGGLGRWGGGRVEKGGEEGGMVGKVGGGIKDINSFVITFQDVYKHVD